MGRMSSRRNQSAHVRDSLGLLEALEPRQLLSFDPSANEQYMLQLLNRMRMNPAAELGLLTSSLGNPAHSSDPDIDADLVYFNTSGVALQQQWNSLTPAAPLAWNSLLYGTAEGHNTEMIAGDVQSHQVIDPSLGINEPELGDRITSAGYIHWTQVGENVYAFAESPLHAHAGFAIDWGTDANGIQNPAGHRENMMDPTYTEVGIAIADPGVRPGKQTGPLVVTQDFGRRYDQGDPYLLGVVYGDANHDGYSPGEGYGGVTITAVAGNGSAGAPSYITTSMTAGGWQIQAPAGTYAVTFSGAGFGAAVTYYNVVIGSQNVEVDGVKGVPPPAPIIQLSSSGIRIANNDTMPSRTDGSDFGNANPNIQAVTKTFTIYNAGNQVLRLSHFIHIAISGANAQDFTLTSDAATTVAAHGSTTFTVSFTPDLIGLSTATISIDSSDHATPTYTFAIQGHGVARPVLQASGNQTAIANADSTPTTADWTSFAGVNTQFATKVRIFTITNIGLKPLVLSGAHPVTITGANANRFAVFVQPTGTLAPGSSAQFRVRFVPGGMIGFAYATIHIASNDPMAPAETFDIRGNGLALPHVQISNSGVAIAAGDGTPSLADKTQYGSVVAAGAANRVRLFTLTNTGIADLSLTGTHFVTLTGPNASDFVVSGQPATGTLHPGQSVTFKVRFDPTTTGTRDATVSIATNDPGLLNDTYTFAIEGTGT